MSRNIPKAIITKIGQVIDENGNRVLANWGFDLQGQPMIVTGTTFCGWSFEELVAIAASQQN